MPFALVYSMFSCTTTVNPYRPVVSGVTHIFSTHSSKKKGSWLTVEIGSKCKIPLVEIKEEPFLVLFTCCLLVAGLSTAPMTVG